MARMYSACPKTKTMPSRSHRSASQYQVNMHSTAPREILAIRRNQLEKRLRRRSDVFGHQHCTFSVEDAHVHRTRVKIHAAIVAMLPGIESHRGLLSKVSVSLNTSLDGSDQLPSPRETGASISISAFEPTAASGLRALAVPLRCAARRLVVPHPKPMRNSTCPAWCDEFPKSGLRVDLHAPTRFGVTSPRYTCPRCGVQLRSSNRSLFAAFVLFTVGGAALVVALVIPPPIGDIVEGAGFATLILSLGCAYRLHRWEAVRE